MLKKYLLTIILSFIISNFSYAFHQIGSSKIDIEATEGLKKKDVQAEYCTQKVSTVTKDELVTEEVIKDGEKINLESIKEKKYYRVESFHIKKSEKAPKILDFSILKNEIDKKNFIGENLSTVENLLSFYCVQEQPKENDLKEFKISNNDNAPISKLYDEIAQINGLEDRNSLIQGDIFNKGKINLSLENKILIYSKAKFITDEENRLAQKKLEEENKAAEIQKEKDFIARVKPGLVDEITKKKLEFDKQIKDYNDDYTKIKIEFERFEKFFKEKTLETEDLLDLVDVSQKDIKDKAIELKKVKREFLNNIIIDAIEDKYKQLSNVKSKDFESYKKLEELLKDIEKKSNRKVCFEEGNKSRLYCNPSFPDQWSRIKQDKLGIESLNINIKDLNKDIDDARKNITNNIDTLNNEIRLLEEELGNQLPWNYIIIGIIIFLVAIGFGFYVYFNNKRIKEIQEDADRTVSTLKTNLEGRLQNTAAELRSVKNARMGQTNTQNNVSSEQTAQAAPPKTPEQLIKDKFDELVSEYEEALDDFSKVATFKQKWNGLALTRKERQDGTKTILISSSRVFEKAEIWCVNFSDKYFAFPGSSVKSNMATYMNLDFEKASRDFKGVYSVSSGTNYKTEPAVLRKGGAGFVVERPGKIVFPS